MGLHPRTMPGPAALRLAIFVFALVADTSAVAELPKFMVEATVKGRYVEGGPLAWSDERVILLARDGQIWDFSPVDAQDYRKTASYFAPYSSREMQERLEAEFGRTMDVTSTGHYLVVHPAGQVQMWADRFEQMYGEFVHNFGVRGISTNQPDLPLVAIVFTRRDDFVRYSLGEGYRFVGDVLGYYSPKSNRVSILDATSLAGAGLDWRQNAATVIHETAHQVAFNTGVHNRFAVTPRWLAEGLGTMFEARGVWDPQAYPNERDRINRGRFADFRNNAASRHTAGTVQELVASDKPFERNATAAYAESWALTFYLAERQPREYAEYLRKTAARPNFVPYTAPQRIADFTSIFGDGWRMLDARVARFMGELR
ncbi:MAG TPA: DUF1570 domain-containing protein [Pirellulales bacterium]|nr:DUF1570 domain-containing protein [Pirellulales bacterium]